MSRKQRERKERKLLEKALSGRMGQQLREAEATLIVPPKHGIRPMSEIIGEIIEPYLAEARSIDEMKWLCNFAMLGWNIALIHQRSGQPLEQLLEILKQETANDPVLMKMAQGFVQAKLDRFAEDERLILSVEVRPQGPNDYRLNVAYLPPKE